MTWLNGGDYESDALNNFTTKENTISIYMLKEDSSNEEMIVCAYTMTRDNIHPVDYLKIPEEVFISHKLEIKENLGCTLFDEVNKAHRDVVKISAQTIVDIIKSVKDSCEIGRITKPKVKKLLKRKIEDGTLKIEELSARFRESLNLL